MESHIDTEQYKFPISRRKFLCQAAALPAALLLFSKASLLTAQTERTPHTPQPDPKRFESGDLIWPKKPGALVPYNSRIISSYDSDRRQWEKEKQDFINSVRNNPAAPLHLRNLANRLERMEFREFLALYLAAEKPGVPGAYGAQSAIYVGHVAILIVKDNGEPFVVEAVSESGIRFLSYQDWISERKDELVWHGRLRDRALSDRSKIANEVIKHVGKPYGFWNFDLADDSSFYCSKLVWLAIFRSLGIAVDDDSNPERSFWYSPKQLMNSPHVYLLNDPGSYLWPH